MQHADSIGKTGVEAIQELGSQRDLRDHDQAWPAKLSNPLHGAKIDLGFSAAGYAVQQKRLEAGAVYSPKDRSQRRVLLHGQRKLAVDKVVLGVGRRKFRRLPA